MQHAAPEFSAPAGMSDVDCFSTAGDFCWALWFLIFTVAILPTPL